MIPAGASNSEALSVTSNNITAFEGLIIQLVVERLEQTILERIAARDGELTRDKIIDWDKEVNEYVATELLIKLELGEKNYISESVKAKYLKGFLSMPMKDLMSEVLLQAENKKDLSHEEKIEDSRTQDKNISFQENSQFLALQASQNKFTLNSSNRQDVIKKLRCITFRKRECVFIL